MYMYMYIQTKLYVVTQALFHLPLYSNVPYLTCRSRCRSILQPLEDWRSAKFTRQLPQESSLTGGVAGHVGKLGSGLKVVGSVYISIIDIYICIQKYVNIYICIYI